MSDETDEIETILKDLRYRGDISYKKTEIIL